MQLHSDNAGLVKPGGMQGMNVGFIGFGVCSMLASVLDLAEWVSHREIERRSIVRHADADFAHACRITRNERGSAI